MIVQKKLFKQFFFSYHSIAAQLRDDSTFRSHTSIPKIFQRKIGKSTNAEKWNFSIRIAEHFRIFYYLREESRYRQRKAEVIDSHKVIPQQSTAFFFKPITEIAGMRLAGV